MKNKLGLTILIIIALSALVWKASNNAKNIPQNTKASVRLKWLHQAQFAGFYVAKANGTYSAEGLNVEINSGGPEISPTQMVLSGTDDFGVVGADQLILAREKGVPLVALAVIYQKTPVALASLKDKNIVSPKQLEHKKVAIVYGRDEEVTYKALLGKENVDRSKIQEVPLTFDLNQLTENKVDAIIVYETNEPILLNQEGFDLNLIKPRDYGINYYADTLFTTEKMLKEHPEIVEKFVKSTIKGWEEALKNKNFAVDETLKINKTLNREHQMRLLEASETLIQNPDGIGRSGLQQWEELQNILLSQGVQNKKIDLNELFTNRYLR